MSVQSTTYHDYLNAVLANAQMKGEYLSGSRVRVSENGHSIHIGGADSEEECGSCTSSSGADGNEVGVFPSQTWSP